MATCQIIYKKGRSLMDEGQIASWRKWTYENLDSKEKFNIEDLRSFDDIFPTDSSPFQMQKAMLEQIQEDIILGTISHEDIVFVICDSSVMCKYDIKDMIAAANYHMKMDNAKFIIIDTHIGNAENMYKMLRKERYPCVDFKILEKNLNIISGGGLNEDINARIIKTNFLMDNHVLTDLEDKCLKKSKWLPGYRNEINDDAQLQILCQLVEHLPHSHGIMISNDRALVQKTDNKYHRSNLNLNALSMK